MSKSTSRKVIPEPVLPQDLAVPAHHHQPQVPDLAQGFVYHLIRQIHQEPHNPYLSYFSAPVLPNPQATPAQFAQYLELALLARQADQNHTLTVRDAQGNTSQLASLDVDAQWKFPYDLYPHAEQQFRAQHGATSAELREECWLTNLSPDFYRDFPADFDHLHDVDDEDDDDYLEEFEQIFGFNFAQMAHRNEHNPTAVNEENYDTAHEHEHNHIHEHDHAHEHHSHSCKCGSKCKHSDQCKCRNGAVSSCANDGCEHDHEHAHEHHHEHQNGAACGCGHEHHGHEHHEHQHHHHDEYCGCGHDYHAYETIDLRANTAQHSRFATGQSNQPHFTLDFHDTEFLLSDEELDDSYAAQARGVTGHQDLVTRVLNDLLDYVDHDRLEMFELHKFNQVLCDYTTLEHQILQQWRNISLEDFAAQLQPYKWNLKSFKDYQVGLQPRSALELERNFNRTLRQIHLEQHFTELETSGKFDVQTLSQIFIEYVNAHYDLEELSENSDSAHKFLENPLAAPRDKFYADFLDPLFAPKFLRLVRTSVHTSDPLEILAQSISLRDYLLTRTLAPTQAGEKSLSLGSLKSNHVSDIVDYFARLVQTTEPTAPLSSSHNVKDTPEEQQGAASDPYAGLSAFATAFLDSSKYPQFAYLNPEQKLTIARYREAQWQRFFTQVQDLLIQYYWTTQIFYRRKLGANNFKLLAHCYFIELHQFLAPHQDGFALWYSLFYSAYLNCYSEYEIQPLLYLQLLNATFNCGKLDITLLQAFERGWIQAQNVFPSLLLNHCALIANQSFAQFREQQAQVYAGVGYDALTGIGSTRVQQLQDRLRTSEQGTISTQTTNADAASYGVHASILEQGTTIPQTSLQVLNNSMHRTSWVGYFDWGAQRVQPLTVFHLQYYADYYKLGNTFIHAPHLPQGMWIWEGVSAQQLAYTQSLSSVLWSEAQPQQVNAQHLPTPTSPTQVTPYHVQQTFVQDHYLYCRLNYDFFPAWGIDYRQVVSFYEFARLQREFTQNLEAFYTQLTTIHHEIRFSAMRSERLLGFCVGLALSRNSFYKQVRVAHDSLEAQEQASMSYQHQLEFERALRYYCNLEQELTPTQQQSLEHARQFFWAVRQVLSFARVSQPVRLFHLCLQPQATRDWANYSEALQEFLSGTTDALRWSYNHTVHSLGLLQQFETVRKMLECIVEAPLANLDAGELVQYRNEFNRVVHGFTRGQVTSSGQDTPSTAGEQLLELSATTLLDESNPLSLWLRCCLDPLTYHLQAEELGYTELSQLRSPLELVLQYFRTDYNTYHTHLASTAHTQALHKAEQESYLAGAQDVLSQGYLEVLVEKYRPQLAHLPLPAQATPELTQWLSYHYHHYYLRHLSQAHLQFFATSDAQLLWPYTDMSGLELVDAQEYAQREELYAQRCATQAEQHAQVLTPTELSYPLTLRGLDLQLGLRYDLKMSKPQ